MTPLHEQVCSWPHCEDEATVSDDGGASGWCWEHVAAPMPEPVSGRLQGCRHCGYSTPWVIAGDALHRNCWRSWLLARARDAA